MKTASYAVIRYVADPGRNEPLNVGILAWDDAGFELRVDDAATARVVRDHPFLARDALRSLRPMIERSLKGLTPFSSDRLETFFSSQSGFPITWSETRLTTLDESRPSPLAHTAERLTERIVRPRRRAAGGMLRPVDLFERQLRPLIRSRAIEVGHVFPSSRTGVVRSADFFANHGASVALDALKLSYRRADDVHLHADAEANKVGDILAENDITYVVYCSLPEDPVLRETGEGALKILRAAGADVSTDFEATVLRVQQAAIKQPVH